MKVASSRTRTSLAPQGEHQSRRPPNGGQFEAEPDLLSQFGAIVAVFWRRRGTIAGVTLLGTALSLWLALSLAPTYTAVASIRIASPSEAGESARWEAQLPGDVPILVESEAAMLRSREVLAAAARELELDSRQDLGELLDLQTEAEVARESEVLSALELAVDARGLGASRVINVSATTRDPEFSAAVVNAVVRAHLERSAAERSADLRAAAARLDEQLSGLESEVRERTRQLNPLRGALTLDPEREAAVLADARAGLQIDVAEATAELRAAEALVARLTQAAASGQLMEQPEVRGHPRVQEAARDVAAARAGVDSIRERVSLGSAQWQAAADELAITEAALAEIIEAVIGSHRAELNRARARVEQIEERVAVLNAQIDEATDALAEGTLRRRELEALVEETESVRNEKLAVEQQLRSVRPLSVTSSWAVAPHRPSGPNRPLVAIAGATTSGILAMLVALIAHGLDRRIYTAEDAQRTAGRTVIGLLPRVTSRERKVKRARAPIAALPVLRPDSAFAAEIRRMALRIYPLESREASPPNKVVLITSSQSEDGKTTVGVALGRTLARFGRSVVLVDAHGAEPNVITTACARGASGIRGGVAAGGGTEKPRSTSFPGGPLNDGRGADEVATLEVALRRALRSDPHSDLWLLDATHERNAFSSRSDWRALLVELHRRHDVIIIDAPEVRAGPEPVLLGSFADFILIVVRAGHTKRMWLKDSVDEIGAGSDVPVGVVLNWAR